MSIEFASFYKIYRNTQFENPVLNYASVSQVTSSLGRHVDENDDRGLKSTGMDRSPVA
jgi:hypothetical protein